MDIRVNTPTALTTYRFVSSAGTAITGITGPSVTISAIKQGVLAQTYATAGLFTWTSIADGAYSILPPATNVDTLGELAFLLSYDSALKFEMFHTVTTANAWDSVYGTDYRHVDVIQQNGTSQTNTIQNVYDRQSTMLGTYGVASVPTIAAHVGTTLVTQGVMQASMSSSIVTGIAGVSASVVVSMDEGSTHLAAIRNDTTALTSIQAAIDAFNASVTLANILVQNASALVAIDLDHLANTACPVSALSSVVAPGSILHQMFATADIALYDQAAMSLYALSKSAVGASKADVLEQVESALTTRQDIVQASDLTTIGTVEAAILAQVESALTTRQDIAQGSELSAVVAGASVGDIIIQVESVLTTRQSIAQTSVVATQTKLTSVQTSVDGLAASVTLANVKVQTTSALNSYAVASVPTVQAVSGSVVVSMDEGSTHLAEIRTRASVIASIQTAVDGLNDVSKADILAQVESALTTRQDIAQGSDVTAIDVGASAAGVLAQIESALTTRQDVMQGSDLTTYAPLQASGAFAAVHEGSAFTDIADQSYLTASASITPAVAMMALFDRMYRAVEQSSVVQHVYNAASAVIATQQVTEAATSSRGPAA